MIKLIRRMWNANPNRCSPPTSDGLAELGLVALTATIWKYRPMSKGKPS